MGEGAIGLDPLTLRAAGARLREVAAGTRATAVALSLRELAGELDALAAREEGGAPLWLWYRALEGTRLGRVSPGLIDGEPGAFVGHRAGVLFRRAVPDGALWADLWVSDGVEPVPVDASVPWTTFQTPAALRAALERLAAGGSS